MTGAMAEPELVTDDDYSNREKDQDREFADGFQYASIFYQFWDQQLIEATLLQNW